MREIKFRAWGCKDIYNLDNTPKEMMSWDDIKLMPLFNINKKDLDFVWQQFTGLKDKNGKDIYEGDVLKENGFVCEVKFRNGYFYCQFEEYTKYIWEAKSNYKMVIGNIFENPELIN